MEDARIDILKAALAESRCIPKAERDALADDLEFAQTINGDPDPTRQMMKRTLISGVRREMLAHERHMHSAAEFKATLRSELSAHVRNCPLAGKAGKDKDGPSSIRIGKLFEASGDAAKIMAAVVVVVGLLVGFALWQNKETRKAIREAVVETASAAARP